MNPSSPPKIAAVEVVPSQPTEADRSAIASMKARDAAPKPEVAFLVKIQFKEMPPVTSHGWALYVNDVRIPKYWAYKDGIYFKILDAEFLAEHDGHPLRFSPDNGTTFIETGKKLISPKGKALKAALSADPLPPQKDVLA